MYDKQLIETPSHHILVRIPGLHTPGTLALCAPSWMSTACCHLVKQSEVCCVCASTLEIAEAYSLAFCQKIGIKEMDFYRPLDIFGYLRLAD